MSLFVVLLSCLLGMHYAFGNIASDESASANDKTCIWIMLGSGQEAIVKCEAEGNMCRIGHVGKHCVN